VPPSQLTSDLIDYKGFALDPEGKRLFTLAKEWEYELVRLYGEEWVRYNFSPEPSALFLDFSPDGRRVTYLREPEGALWVSALDGTQKKRLTEPGLQVPAFPRWSPDSQKIAFTLKKRTDDGGQIHVIRLDRTDPQIVLDEEFLQHSASWAPDGKLLVSYLWGTQPLKLVDLESGTVEEIPDSKDLHAAVYSPDGRFIAAQRTGGEDGGKLAIYDKETERWSTVQDAHPRLVILWSRDSRHLYFSGPPRTLYRVRIADWEIEKVADFDDFGSQSPLDYRRADAWWFCFDPDETLVSTRVPTATEIYTRDLEWP
jgi:dipeptidyl aminopeptidase/acylaminoacyl peptidase